MTAMADDLSGKIDSCHFKSEEGRKPFQFETEGADGNEMLVTPDFDKDDIFSMSHSEEHRLSVLTKVQPAFQVEGEEPYRSMVELAKDIFGVPICLLSLVYDDFQWFKAGVGLGTQQTPRCQSFCAHTFIPIRPEVLYIPDAQEDERFKDNALVTGPPFIRFYVGCPLVTADDVRLGALCLIDHEPRKMRREDMRILINLGEVIVRELLRTETARKYSGVGGSIPAAVPSKKRHSIDKKLPSMKQLRKDRDSWFHKGLGEGVLVVDINTQDWRVRWTNNCWMQWSRNSGLSQVKAAPLMSVLRPANMVGSDRDLQAEIERQIREDASGQTSFIGVVVRDGITCDKRFSVRATLVDRPGVTADNSWINLPGQDIIPLATAKKIDLGGASYLVLQVTQAVCAPDASKDPAASSIAPLPEELPKALPILLEATCSPGASKDAAASIVMQPVELPKAQDATMCAGVVEVFVRHDKEGTRDVSREQLIAICSKLRDCRDRNTIEALIDSSGLAKGGRINYSDFFAWLFAGFSDGEELPGSVRPSP